MELAELRGLIDTVDAQLFELFCERMRLVAAVGTAKSKLGLPINDDRREREICSHAVRLAGKELAPYAWQFCRALFTIAKEYQVQQSSANRQKRDTDDHNNS